MNKKKYTAPTVTITAMDPGNILAAWSDVTTGDTDTDGNYTPGGSLGKPDEGQTDKPWGGIDID